MSVNFQTFAQKKTYIRVQEWLPQLYDRTWPLEDAPGFGVTAGSAFAVVMIRPMGDAETVVHVSSVVVRSTEVSPRLMRFLLQKNNEFFSAASLSMPMMIYLQPQLSGYNSRPRGTAVGRGCGDDAGR